MVKQPCLFSPKFGTTSPHIFTQTPQNVAVELGIQSLACWCRGLRATTTDIRIYGSTRPEYFGYHLI
jgi:hypothetical protein